jgi:hypothetical protein
MAVGCPACDAPDAILFQTYADLEGYLWSFPRTELASTGPPVSPSRFSASTHRPHAWQYMASAARSTSEYSPASISIPTTRRHSFCPYLHRCRGAYGVPEGTGTLGSRWFSGRFPGFPTSSLMIVGFGAGPGLMIPLMST